MSQLEYRRDIDGLRAVAVMLVLLFHVGLGWPGGFIGVDVFFVISGYLITRIIRNKQQTGTFRLSDFWGRRIRRLAPASMLVVAVALLAGGVLLLPGDYEELGKSALAQQLMVANIFFWQESGYFAGAADLKPLLHCWSLAVEEQFYLGYPIVLVLLRRTSARVTAAVLVIMGLASFAACQWLIQSYPSAAFYLLPTRAWELLLGGLVALLPLPSGQKSLSVNLLSWTGLLAIFGTAWFYHANMRFPGAAALLPCAGAALVIYANSHSRSTAGRLLGTQPFVFIGLISYSLYLWHWPILVFARIWWGGALPTTVVAAVLALSLALATLSWRFVELPFRQQPQRRTWHGYGAFACSAAALASLSFWVVSSEGIQARIPASFPAMQARASQGPEGDADGDTINALPMIGDGDAARPDFIVWGDSHAAAIAEVCDRVAKQHHVRGAFSTKGGFVPLLGVWRGACPEMRVAEWNQMVFDYIQRNRIPNVILVGAWSVYTEGPPYNQICDAESGPASNGEARAAFSRAAQRTIDQLEACGARVWIVGQCPDYDNRTLPKPRNMLEVWMGLPENRRLDVSEHQRRQANVETIFNQLTSSYCAYVSPAPSCFDSAGKSLISDSAGYYYVDTSHVSNRGADRFFSDLLSNIFREVSQTDYNSPSRAVYTAGAGRAQEEGVRH